jgi:protein-disulfide isomerase
VIIERGNRVTKIDLRWTVACLALIAAGCDKKADEPAPTATAGPASVQAPAGGWAEAVSTTPDGGFVMGNPAAKVKLVEYMSMTCPHCADFAINAMPQLKDRYISTGNVSLEVRNFIRDPIDVTASMVTRCAGPGPFFKMTEQMFASQMDWITKYQGVSQAEQSRIGALPENQQYAALARVGGLDQFAQQRGVASDKLSACLSDLGARDKLVEMNKTATEQYRLTGTPSFLINGEMVENAFNWASLEPKLRAALAS